MVALPSFGNVFKRIGIAVLNVGHFLVNFLGHQRRFNALWRPFGYFAGMSVREWRVNFRHVRPIWALHPLTQVFIRLYLGVLWRIFVHWVVWNWWLLVAVLPKVSVFMLWVFDGALAIVDRLGSDYSVVRYRVRRIALLKHDVLLFLISKWLLTIAGFAL